MQKDFTKWHQLKNVLNCKDDLFDFFEKQVWFCSIGANLGDEQDGKNQHFERPVLILRKFNKNIFWGIPLTSRIKGGKYYFVFECNKKQSCAILSQMRLFDIKRLRRHFGEMRNKDFNLLNQKLLKLIKQRKFDIR